MWTRGGRTRPSFFCWLSLGIIQIPWTSASPNTHSPVTFSRVVFSARRSVSQPGNLVKAHFAVDAHFATIPSALLDVPRAAPHFEAPNIIVTFAAPPFPFWANLF